MFALNGYLGLTLGTLVSFLTLNKNASQPVSQISQQMNSIAMAMAGAQRIFDLMDEHAGGGQRLCGTGPCQGKSRRQSE